MTILYKNIQNIREKRGIKSLRQLETEAGIPLGTIKRWKEKPSAAIDALDKLSSYLKCPMNSFLRESNDIGPIDRVVYELGKYCIDDATASLIIKMIHVAVNKETSDMEN